MRVNEQFLVLPQRFSVNDIRMRHLMMLVTEKNEIFLFIVVAISINMVNL